MKDWECKHSFQLFEISYEKIIEDEFRKVPLILGSSSLDDCNFNIHLINWVF